MRACIVQRYLNHKKYFVAANLLKLRTKMTGLRLCDSINTHLISHNVTKGLFMLNKYAPQILLILAFLNIQTYATQSVKNAVEQNTQTSNILPNDSANDLGGFIAVGAGAALCVGYNLEPYVFAPFCPKDPGPEVHLLERSSYEKSLWFFNEAALNIKMSALFVCSAAATAGSSYTLYKDYKDGKKESLKHYLLAAALAVSAYGLLRSSEYLCKEAYGWANFYWCEWLKTRP